MSRAVRWLLLACLLAGCRKTPEQRACAELAERLSRCKLPVADEVRRHCEVSLAYPSEPDAAAPSLAELERRAFAECVSVTGCDAVFACLARHGCQLIVTGPDDHEPKLLCSGAPANVR